MQLFEEKLPIPDKIEITGDGKKSSHLGLYLNLIN